MSDKPMDESYSYTTGFMQSIDRQQDRGQLLDELERVVRSKFSRSVMSSVLPEIDRILHDLDELK